VGLYARDLWIEGWPVVDKVDPSRGGFVTQQESGVSSVRGRSKGAAIKSHRKQKRCEERYRDDGAPNGGAGSVEHR
jgi:hypothetical protein